MGKSFEFKECERFLKRVLKDKGMYSKGAVIAFLITGGIGFFAPPAQAIIYVETDLTTGATGASSYYNNSGSIHLPRNSVVLAPIKNGDLNGDLNRNAKDSVIIGAGAVAHGITAESPRKFTAVGNAAHVFGGQGTAVGSNALAAEQATAIGNDVYAAGASSIAIGNDDISTKYRDIIPLDTIKELYGDPNGKNDAAKKLFRNARWYSSENDDKGTHQIVDWNKFATGYNQSDESGNRIFSPTYSGGIGSIAIGSRSIAAQDGATAMGTLAYALGEGSTAMGLRAYTADKARGAVAIGEESRSFANQSLAVGNHNESTEVGAMSYGYSAKAVGRGSLAFGFKTYANANIIDNIAAADGHNATNPLRQAVRSTLGNYSEAQLKALADYQNAVSSYYGVVANTNASAATLAAEKEKMDKAKANVDTITLTDVNNMTLVDAGQVGHQGKDTVGSTINTLVKRVEANTTTPLTVEKQAGVYLTTKDSNGDTQLVQKSQKSGDNAIAIGYYASAKGTSSIAQGSGSVVDSLSGIGIGSLSYVSDKSANSIAVGVGAQVRKENSVAIGTQSTVFGAGAIGMGPGSRIMGDNSIGMGYGADIRSVSSVGVGVRASVGYGSMNATGLGSNVTIGTDAGNSVALGSSASVGDNSLNSMAVGFNANIAQDTPNSIAFGTRATISKEASSSVAIGDSARVTKASSTALGRLASADFENSVALGYRSTTHYWGDPNTRQSNFSASASATNVHGLSIDPYLPQGSTLGTELAKLNAVTAGYVSVGGWDEKGADGKSTGRRGLRRIVNVAPGALDTDAVTVAQLRDWTDKSAHFLSIAGASNKSAKDYPDINDPLGTKSNNQVVKIKSNFDNDTATGTNALALGVYAYANGQKSVALGPNAYANVDHGVAIGDSAQAWSEGSNGNAGVAIGKEAKAYYWNALALGTNARVSGAHSLAFGPNARVGVVKTVDATTGNVTNEGAKVNDGIAIGRDTAIDGTGSVALGATTKVTTATNAVAIGLGAQVLAKQVDERTTAESTGAVALGSNASVTGSKYSVALGLNSAVEYNDTKDKTKAAFTNEEINDPGNGVVSVGNNSSVKRRIINVASGVNDNDAVTVKQLKAVAPKYYSVNTTDSANRTVNGVDNTKSNINNDGAAGTGSVAIGSYTSASGNYATAIGRDVITSAQLSTGIGTNVTVSGQRSVGIGNEVRAIGSNTVAIGSNGAASQKVEAVGNDAVAIGTIARAYGGSSVALGRDASTGYTTTETITNPPAGGPTTSTVYKGASEGVAIGNSSYVDSNYAIAIGGNAKVERDTSDSTKIKDSESSVAIGAGAKVTGAKYSVALGLNSRVNAADTATKTTAAFSGEVNDDPGFGVVSVGQSGKYRRILNVAGGVNDNDAVNVKQLKAAAWGLQVENGSAAATDVTPDVTSHKIKLKAGNNVTLDNSSGVVTINATGIQSVSSGDSNALSVTTANGAVTITPNLAGSVSSTDDANKLVTAGVVNTALNAKANASDLAAKLDKTAELHVRAGDYTVATNGEVSLIQEDASGMQNNNKGFKIKGLATKGDITNINTTLAGKADKSYVDTQIGTVSNLGYKANGGTAKSVAVTTGLDFVQGDGTTATAESAKSGLNIVAGDNGKVIIGLSEDAKAKLDKVTEIAKTVGANGVDGRDGKPGTGADAGMGAQGPTGQDGLNGKDLTTKVNALRNGEAGTVVYTDESGKRVVKAKDGKWYLADKVGADGTKAADATEVTAVQARLVNPTGSTTTTTKLSNIADGNIAAGSTDAINGGQLHTELAKKADVTALAGKVDKSAEFHVKADTYAVGADGVVTVKQEDGTGTEAAGKEFKISGLATKTDITNINTTLGQKANISDLESLKTNPITFTGDDTQAVTRALGTTLTVKGAENFTPSATTPATDAGVNIRVEKDPTTNANGLVVKLADTLTKMKGISGNGTDPLTIKNGDNAVITVKPGATGTKGDVDFGGSKLTNIAKPGTGTDAANKDYVDEKLGDVAKLGYKAHGETTVNKVAVGTGLTFTPGTGTVGATGADATTTNAATPKTGIAISTAADGVVNIGLDEATRSAIDNAATKGDITNINNALADKADKSYVNTKVGEVSNLGYKANGGTAKSVAVTTGLDFVQGDGTTATAESAKSGLNIVAGDNGKVIIGLSEDAKTKLDKVTEIAKTVGANGVDGRDGKPGTGADAGMGAQGPTGQDGLNGKDLTSKVNALRNGEAGTVVYTDESGKRVVKAKDGKWYLADKVGADGTKAADATEVTAVQARLVNPTGSTTTTTKLSNIADGNIAAGSTDAINGGQLHTELAKKADVTALAGKVDKDSELHVKADTYAVGNDGVVTVKQEDGTGAEATGKEFKISGLATKTDITTINTALSQKANAADPITFTGDDAQNVTRALGTTLTVKGATNFTPSATTPATEAGVNIRVEKDLTTNANGLVVKLADTLTNMKGISGNGTDSLTIKNGDNAVITVKPGAAGAKGDVDFGGSKLTNVGAPGANTDAANKFYVDEAIKAVNQTAAGNANLAYKANTETGRTVAVTTGLTFKSGTGTVGATGTGAATTNTTTTKTGIAISTEDGGIVNIGLDANTRTAIDKVATLESAIGNSGADGRDGKPGTGADAGMGAQGPTGQDGLNGKDLTSKVNALRNGEAGTVVYTDESGKRVVKAKDGKWYLADKVGADGTKAADATEVTAVQARLVNPTGSTTTTTKLSNIADGNIAAGSTDAINGGQLHTELAKKADVTALAGKVDKSAEFHVKADTYAVGADGVVTVKQEDGTGTEATGKEFKISGLATKTDITNINTTLGQKANASDLNTLAEKPLTFSGDTGTNATRKLGETLAVKGAVNFTPAATATPGVNIQVASDPTNGLTVSLADTLTNMKGISGNGTNDLVIKNGDNAVITVKPGAAGAKGDVDFGGSKLTNVGAPGANTDAANKAYVDTKFGNAANKDLDNLNDAGKNEVRDLAASAVKVAAGKNVTVTPTTENHVTTYTVDAIDTTVVAGEGLSVSGGDTVDTTTNKRNYTVALSQDTKDTLAKVQKAVDAIGTNGSDGRDGKPGTGADAGMGAQGPTGQDGLNGKDLTSKVNALRNGEAGTVVYTDENGKRVVKAKDGKWYLADKVGADGTKAADATEVTAVQARLVNPTGSTTTTTKLSNIADGNIAAGSTDAINGGQLHTELAKKADVTALAGKVDKDSELHVKADTYAVGNDGVVTVKQEDGTGAEATGKEFKISGLATKTDITTINTTLGQKANASDLNTLAEKPLTFSGDTGTNATRKLGETLAVKGAANFTPAATATAGVNIQVASDPTNGLTVSLADTLTNMKGISGNGTDPLTIKNGDNAVITVKPGAAGAKGDVDFGGSKLTNVGAPGANTDAANKFYVDEAIKAVNQTAAGNANLGYKANGETAKTVAVTTGLDFVQGDGTTATAEAAKAGIEIVAGDNGKVIIGLSNDAKTKLDKVNDIAKAVGDNGVDGRDGKPGTGADAGMGKDGLTKEDGLNGKDLTTKVNALRNGEAGIVVYTDDQGNRVVKADDGKWYPAGKVKADGTKVDDAVEVTKPQARLVNTDGTTTGGTTVFNNVASAIPAAAADGAKPTFLDNLNTAANNDKTKHAVVNVSDLNSTATEIIAKGLTFQGNDAKGIKKQLGETLDIVGEGTVPATTTTAANNIRTKKTDDGKLEIGLAKDLVGITSVTNAATTDGAGTKLALDGDTLTITNTQPLPAGAAPDAKPAVTKVTIGKDGINAGNKVISNVATPNAGTDAANKAYVDTQFGNAANKDLDNLNDAGKNEVRDLAASAVKVAAGKNVTVTPTTENHVTTYTVDAIDTTVVAGEGLSVSGGDTVDTTTNKRNYTVALSQDTKDTLAKVQKAVDAIGTNGSDGRDGKPGTGADAGMGAQGPTGQDGLNGKDLTSKVNALRNGEAGTVVYTDENGKRVVKAKDGKWYLADKVDATGNKLDGATEVTTVQARLVNPDGSTTTAEGATGTKLSNIANGTIADKSKDAVNGGQLHTAKQEMANALGGSAGVDANGALTQPTYSITKDDEAGGTDTVNNVGAAVDKLDTRINTVKGLAKQPLTFTGDDAQNVERALGTTLTVKGAKNFTPATDATAGVNIRVEKDATENANGLVVKLADTLTNMKGISGNGTDPLVIKNGDQTITITPTTAAETSPDGAVTKPAQVGKVDFGNSKITSSATPKDANDLVNKGYLEKAIENVNNVATGNASLGYKANTEDAKSVNVNTGLHFKSGTGTIDATGTGAAATNAATTKTGIAISTEENGVVNIGLDEATRKVIDSAAKLGDTAADGRDGKAGTGKAADDATAVAGDKGLTGQDGLNGKDLTSKVNALRNGEAGTVVYTDDKGNRLVKANDGKWYNAKAVNDKGELKPADQLPQGVTATPVDAPQARLVNPDGSTTTAEGATGTKLSNITNGTIADKSKDAVNGGQLHTAKQEMANALGGNASVDANGALTQPTYSITKDDEAGGKETVNNVGAAVDKLDTRINTVKGLAKQPLTFTGDDAQNVERALGTTLTVKGAKNFTPAADATAGMNIRVEKDPTIDANGLVVKLADTLTDMKGISGNGTDNLVIKNGTNTITVTPGTPEVKDDQDHVTKAADPGKVNFGDATVTVKDLEAPITYRANGVADDAARSVSLKKGLDFVTGDGTTATAEAAKAGLHIETGDNGKVIIGLSDDAKAKLDKVNDIAKAVGTNGVDGRDGKPGTGADAGMGKDGLTAADGLNGKDLTTKVNALRNGEAGSVVYTDENGNRVVKANDGKWYPAGKVNADGTKAADAVEVTKPQARLVNPDGTTTGGTTVFNNVASVVPAAAADGAKPTFLDNLNTAANNDKTKHAAVNVSDLNNTATEIIAKGLTFQGNDAKGIKKQLGETLDIVGEGTVATGAITAANNIRTKKTDDGKLEIGLAKDLVGITSVTNATTTDGAGTKLVLDGDTLTITNTQAVPENAAPGTAPTVTTVTIGKDGINAGNKVISNVAAPTANTDAANKEYVDTKVGEATAAATGNAKLGYKANSETETKKVGVADGLHFKSGTGTIAPTDLAPNTESPTKDTDSKEAKTGIAITTEENGVVNIGLDEVTRKVIDSAAKLGNTATDGRDGKTGTGKAADDATAVAGDKGLTGKDGLNGQDLTSKVNALRNGEAGTVVYTDDKGNRLVKANDGKWYNAKAVNDKGELKPADQLPQGVTATPVDTPQARLVSPDGTTTTAEGATGTKLSNIADGTIGENSKDAINGGQLHTELAKKADVTALNELADKALTFSADTGTNATRKLGTTLAVKGAANFTPAATATPGVNIQVASDPTNGLTVSLADTLTEMKGISGNGTDPLTIKNGDNAVITVNPGANGAKGEVDFGGSKLTNIGTPGANTDAANKAYVDSKVGDVANLGYKANNGTAKQVAVGTGLNFVQGDGTANTAESVKAGIEIIAGDDGKVTFGLNEATRNAIDNAANKDLGNLSDNGKNAVKDLAAGAVKVAAGKNVAVTPKTTDHVTTYTVDAIDTKVIKGDGIEVTGGDEDTDKVRTYTVALSQATKDTLAKVADIAKAVGADGANGIDGRDGKSGTGNNAGMGKDGLTGADGLNGKDLTTKVNALRNGEAGTVVYTDDKGNRVVKASDGKWYPDDKVKADGTKADDAVEVKTPQARLVNPDGSTTGGTTIINNVASAIPNIAKDGANQPIANPTFLDRLNTAAGDVNTKHAAVNVSDLNNTAKDIITKGLTFQGDDVKDVTRALGTTLTVKGATNFTPAADATAGVNIRVEKDTTAGANGLVVKLADTLTDMKGISGNGTDNLVIKNGTNTITVTPGKAADGATKADPGKVNFGDATVTVKDLDAPITYRTNSDADEKAKTVSLKQGLDFVTGDGTTNTAESAKPGLNIVTGENGKVIIGLSEDAVTKLGKVDGIAKKVDAVEKALDNKADKSTVEDLANKLADKADKSTVADLAKTVEGKADKSELANKADKGEVTALANKAMTFTGNKADETVDRKLGETLHLVGTNNITVEKDANKDDTLNVTLASTLTGMESITTKAVDGLSNTTWDPTKVASAEEAKAKPDSDAAKERSKAATQGQLKDVADRVSKGRVFTADTKVNDNPLEANVGLGDTLAIQGGATGELTNNNIGVELALAKDGKPATMTVKLAKNVKMADGSITYDRYVPEFEKDATGLVKSDDHGKPIPKKDDKGNIIYQKDGNGNPIVNSSTVVDGTGTTYIINNLKNDGTVQVDNENKPVPAIVTKVTATGTRYEERLTADDGKVIFKQDDDTKVLQPIIKTVSVVDSNGIRIGSHDKPLVSLTKDGLNNGGNRITNVSPGIEATDAATVGQLQAVTNTVTAKVNEAGAHAAALAAMNPLSYDPLKKSQVMAGVGAYKGNKALALGVAHYANEDTMFNVGISVGGGENMMNAGVTYRFGGEDSMIPERYKGGPISSVYILQDEVSALKAENAQVKADNEQVKADNARMKENYEKVMQDNEEMKAQIKMLMAHMGIK